MLTKFYLQRLIRFKYLPGLSLLYQRELSFPANHPEDQKESIQTVYVVERNGHAPSPLIVLFCDYRSRKLISQTGWIAVGFAGGWFRCRALPRVYAWWEFNRGSHHEMDQFPGTPPNDTAHRLLPIRHQGCLTFYLRFVNISAKIKMRWCVADWNALSRRFHTVTESHCEACQPCSLMPISIYLSFCFKHLFILLNAAAAGVC